MGEMEEIVCLLEQKDLTLSVAESMTGGAFSDAITDVPGSSKVYLGGMVAYTPGVKTGILGMNDTILEQAGTVSKETAEEMAVRALEIFYSDISVAITGNAGPTVENGDPGQVFICIHWKDGHCIEEHKFTGKRRGVKVQAVEKAADMLLKFLEEKC